MQEMNSSVLASQSLKQLKHYINSYNLPAQHALEKDDLVKLIFNTRPLTNQNERHYRMLRDQQYNAQLADNHQNGEGDSNGMDFFDDNPITAAFNKFSEIFTPGEIVTPQSSTSTPPRRSQQPRPPPPPPQQQQQQRPSRPRDPPPPAFQNTSHAPYPTYIYQDTPQRSSPPRPSSTPARTTTSATSTPSTPPPPQPNNPSPPSPPSPTVTLKEIMSLSTDPSTLSVRTLKTLLRNSHVELNFALEKKELVTRVQQLLDDEKKLQKEVEDEDHVCRICYDAQQNCVFLNCGHMATCIDCGLRLVETKNECPICRDLIVRVVRVFRS